MASSKSDVIGNAVEDDSSDDEMLCDDGWEECDEELLPESKVCCLFCSSFFSSPVDVLLHCKTEHSFDIARVKAMQQLESISYIKLINFIRQTKPDVAVVTKLWPKGTEPWNSDCFMKPVIEDDAMLLLDIEELPTELNSYEDSLTKSETGEEVKKPVDSVDGATVSMSIVEYNKLMNRLKHAEEKLGFAEEALELNASDLKKMRDLTKDTLFENSEVLPPREEGICSLRADEDEFYFESYGHFSIHEEMLKDRVRTESYRDCILSNEAVFKDKVVLDIGCGTGILSMFAAKAGAKLVIGVDQSDIIYNAIDIVRENGYQDKITLIKGKMEEVNLPVTKVDIIISEWMGYFLLFESMLDTILWARNRFLAEDGLVFPNHCSLHLVGIEDEDMHSKRFAFWDDVYGFRMSCMRKAILAEADVTLVNGEKIITESCILKDFAMQTVKVKDVDFCEPFTLAVRKEGRLTALVGYFDVRFGCPSEVSFSTSPVSAPTHWKQTVFPLDSPIPVKEGETLTGQLTCKKNIKDPRTLVISIKLSGKTYVYKMQ